MLACSVSVQAQQDNFKPFTADSFAEIKASFAGQEFLLGLWSVDCPPCLVELDMMGELLALNPDLPFVLISTDPIEEREAAAEFLEDFGLAGYESWMFADSFTERLRFTVDPAWYGELPRSYFFDSNHQQQPHSGIMTPELLESWFSREVIFPD
jgi:thiol-disulfide isomerase/thioredoxin